MENYHQKRINITKLSVNPDNVRYETSAADQTEAIRMIIKEQGRKFVNLAKHIATHGLEPGRAIYVHPINDNKQFIILDGNRRASALKVLSSSQLQKEFKDILPRGFNKIVELYQQGGKIESVECIVFPDSEDAQEWISVNHGFGDDGITTQDWNSDVKNKVMASYNKKKRERDGQLLDYLRVSKHVDEGFKERINKEKTKNTILRRFLSTDVLPLYGIRFEKGMIHFSASQKEIVKSLVKVIEEILDKKINTDTVRDEERRKIYTDRLREEGALPDLSLPPDPIIILPQNNDSDTLSEPEYDSTKPSTVMPNDSTESSDSGVSITSVPTEQTASVNTAEAVESLDEKATSAETDEYEEDEDQEKEYSKPKAIKKSREHVFSKPFTFNSASNNSRIIDIYNELVKIKVTENPNAVSFLLRAFVEMIVKEYDKKHRIQGTGKDVPLREAVSITVTHFQGRHQDIDQKDFRGILEACEKVNTNSIFSIESFQQLVHRIQLKPIPSEVISRWDNIEPAIVHLLDKM